MKASIVEMEGLLRGKCVPAKMLVNESLAEYLVRQFDSLHERVEAAERERDELREQFDKLASAAGWSKEECDQTGGSPFDVVEDLVSAKRERDELRAEQQPVWNGEGLPPVGAECEVRRVADWMPVTIKFISEYHTVFKTFGGTEDCYQTCSLQFRPIRTEAERKREKIAEALIRFLDQETDLDNPYRKRDVQTFIDYIEAGEIPGVRLSDG